MRGLQQHLEEFNKRNVRVNGISVDTPEQTKKLCEQRGYTFSILADTEREVIRRYDLVHAGGGPGSSDIARPAEFLLDAEGGHSLGESDRRLPGATPGGGHSGRDRPPRPGQSCQQVRIGSGVSARVAASGWRLHAVRRLSIVSARAGLKSIITEDGGAYGECAGTSLAT
ncbi:MAG: redoxin domain-containing protein [Acidobacteria bacterium]|nr:redoxin domain-containing protein [Acidobacteriota bacterium]